MNEWTNKHHINISRSRFIIAIFNMSKSQALSLLYYNQIYIQIQIESIQFIKTMKQ